MWIAADNFDEQETKETLTRLNVTCGNRALVFSSIYVILIKATKEQLKNIVCSIGGVSEFRPYCNPSVLLRSDIITSDDYCTLIGSHFAKKGDMQLSRIGILDSGVNNAHPLIKSYLPDERCLSAVNPPNGVDRRGHGTPMASVALYGDLADVIKDPRPTFVIESDLVSVKILSDKDPNDDTMYAVITEDAIVKAREEKAQILCSAVTDGYDVNNSTASATSAAIDQALFNQGRCDSMMLLSAGNTATGKANDYPDYLYRNNIQDPSQSWNVLTVGAYTEKDAIAEENYDGAKIVAPAGGLCPYTSTSVNLNSGIIKPEILMEGGNAMDSCNDITPHEDLEIVGADSQIGMGKFICINATSAATALAAHLAGQIKYKYPSLSPLTIRALLVHSAEWTPVMKEMATKEDGKVDEWLLIHSCGYGVPNRGKALMSTNSYVTFIAEDEIKPIQFDADKTALKYRDMNVYTLPWPSDILRALGEEEVALKITLSYYIDPSPGARDLINKYVYPSYNLYFDINRPTETEDDFITRISKPQKDDDSSMAPSSGNKVKWEIGKRSIQRGSIHSNTAKMTAAEMASCRYIAITPSSGWYQRTKGKASMKDKADVKVKYSLVVSLETPEQDIYSEIMTQMTSILQPVPISINNDIQAKE